MTKLPFMLFYPDLWLRDTRKLSPAAKAAWIDILAYCWNEPERGVYRRPRTAMCRELGIADADLAPILDELSLTLVADITVEPDNTVLIVSRRIRNEEMKRDYERKKKQRQRRPAGVPDMSPEDQGGSPGNVPGKTLDVRCQTSEVTTPPLVPLQGDRAFTTQRPRKRRPATDPKHTIENWQDLVDHIDQAWKTKKGAPYPWDGQEFKKLHGLAKTYRPAGVMAMFDLYMQMQTYFGKLTGYTLDGLKKDLGVIVDDPRWKPITKGYNDKFDKAATPEPETVPTKDLIAGLMQNAKRI